jgi:hypothetical protein
MKTYKPSQEDSTMIESPDGEYILKKDIQPILDTFNKIKEELHSERDNVIDFIKNLIKSLNDYEELQDIPFEQIALHINNYNPDSYQFYFLSCRLSNKDPFNNIGSCIPLLYDQNFDVVEYREIGKNDGVIEILSRLLNIIGFEKEAKEISKAIYTYFY